MLGTYQAWHNVTQCVMRDCRGTARWDFSWLASPNNLLRCLITALHAVLRCTLVCSQPP